jgi:hypothetical protein
MQPGGTVGTDYSQLHVAGSFTISNVMLRVGTGGGSCPALTEGEEKTLITTSGAITGTFSGLSNGTTLTMSCIGTAPKLRITYSEHALTATVVSGESVVETTTGVSISPESPTTNQTVKLTATVAASHSIGKAPSGSVQFFDNGTPVGVCEHQPLTQGSSSSTAACSLSYSSTGKHAIRAVYGGDSSFSGSVGEREVNVQSPGGGREENKGGGESNSGGATTGTTVVSNTNGTVNVLGTISSSPPAPVLGQRQTASVTSGTVLLRAKGASTFTPLSGSTSIPDGSEVEATNGHVVITAATLKAGQTVSAEVYGGRFRIHQDAKGETHFILTLPLTGCPRVTLPHGSAAAVSAKHRSGPRSRHLWVSETGGKWGTNGRYVSTSVEGTRWLTTDECNRSQVRVAAGKVVVDDLTRRKTQTLTAGKLYVAVRRGAGRA